MTDASLRGDCSRCIGLCCVALAFDRGPSFAFDKAAGEACRHLTNSQRCAIHDRLAVAGLAGCVTYDCFGAGQIVSAAFAGLSWRDTPAVARQMFAAFATLREVQMLRRLVGDDTLDERLARPGGWSFAAILAIDLAALRAEVRQRLAARRTTAESSGALLPASPGHDRRGRKGRESRDPSG